MKTKHFILSLILLTITFSGCREISVSTIINKDGSFMRIVKIVGDSSEVFKSSLPYPIDDSWEQKFEKDSTDEKSFILTYSKQYAGIDELNTELKADTSWRKDLQREINIQKTFGFFYSYIQYSEVLQASNPFTRLDYKDYFTNEDMKWVHGKKLVLSRQDSIKNKAVEEKVEAYLEKAFAEEIIFALDAGIRELQNPNIKISQLEEFRDSIAAMAKNFDGESTLDFVDHFAGWIQNEEALQLKKVNPETYADLDLKLEFLIESMFQEDYNVIVEMPGLITKTNSLEVIGNSVSWKITPILNLIVDNKMEVESRIINQWMFYLSGAIVLLLLVLIILKSRK
jgi:hypothetical protein